MLVKAMPVGPIGTNCYLFGDEEAKVCAVIDPGDDAPEIQHMIEESGLRLAMILMTHGHFDHVTALPSLQHSYPGVPVYIHREDYAQEGEAKMYQMPAAANVIFCREGDALKLGGLTIHVLETPGHTPGSVTFQVGEVLFTGDTLFRGSMGRTDFPGGSYEVIMRSLKKLALLPGDYRVCPGHEGLSTLEAERQSNYYLKQALSDA